MKELGFLSYDLNNYQAIIKHALSHAFDQLDNQIPEATFQEWLQEFDYQVGQKHGKELGFLSYDLNNYQAIIKHALSHAFDQLDNQIPEATLEKWLLTSKPFYCSDKSLVNC